MKWKLSKKEDEEEDEEEEEEEEEKEGIYMSRRVTRVKTGGGQQASKQAATQARKK